MSIPVDQGGDAPERTGAPGGTVREEVGRTVEDAVARALEALGLSRGEVTVEVLDEGSRGVLGLGVREARVRVAARRPRAASVKEVTEELLGRMGFSTRVAAEEAPEAAVRVAVEGEDLSGLIGKHGQTLGALEMIVGMMAGRRIGAPVRVELDILGYRERRRQALEALAMRTAEQVGRSGREAVLSPMDARDRRVIHLALQGHPRVATVSRGEGDMRRVVVVPRPGPSEDQNAGPADRRQRGHDRNAGVQPRRAPSGSSGGRDAGSDRGRPGRARAGREATGRGRRPQEKPNQPWQQANGVGNRRGHGEGVAGPRGRPPGLPVDEELEAEIEQLEKRRQTSRQTMTSSVGGAEGDPEAK